MSLANLATSGNYNPVAPQHFSSVFAQEGELRLSREKITILAGDGAARTLPMGTVYGHITLGAVTVAADGGNTGNGTVTGVARGVAAKPGDYTLTCIAAAVDGGRFQVVDPAGYRLADALVGAGYATSQLAFTLGDGATDWAVGDLITLTVAAGAGKAVALDPAATDGSQIAAGVIYADVTAPAGADATGVGVHRDAVVIDTGLIWPAGITGDQKTAALAQLANRRIVSATGV